MFALLYGVRSVSLQKLTNNSSLRTSLSGQIIETCSVFHCAAVPRIEIDLKIFGDIAAQWNAVRFSFRIQSDLSRHRRMKQQRVNTACRVCQKLINYKMQIRYDLSYWQSAFCNTVWFVLTAAFNTLAQCSNWHVSMHYDTIRPAADNSFLIRYNF